MGGISAGGLITGLDTNAIVQQLMQLERQPINRMRTQVQRFGQQRTTINNFRNELSSLLTRVQSLGTANAFKQFAAASSVEGVVRASVNGTSPATGTFQVETLQLASATIARGSARLGASINPSASLATAGINTAVTEGSFTINGVSINVDPNANSLDNILNAINSSAAGVIATYNATTDTVSIENENAGDTSFVNLGASTDTSNFLNALNLLGATQSTGGNGATVVESSRNLGAVNPGSTLNGIAFAGGAVTAGSFAINGVSINVDPANDSLNDVLARINGSDAGVTASYDSLTDSILVVADALGSRTIKFTAGSSNFLSVTNLDTAVQEAGQDSQFRINGGPIQTRNSNSISDAIAGVTLDLVGPGTSTITVGVDDEAILDTVRGFLEEFNGIINRVRTLTGQNGELPNDGSIRSIGSSLRQLVFSQVGSGTLNSLVAAGFNTGATFTQGQDFALQIDEAAFLQALRDDPDALARLFSNDDKDGVADLLEEFIEGAAGLNGYLQDRTRPGGSIDARITGLEQQIERQEARLVLRETRLRQQFARMEQLASSFQQAGASLATLSNGLGMLQNRN
jgi:flagellar hook-associated protein 2